MIYTAHTTYTIGFAWLYFCSTTNGWEKVMPGTFHTKVFYDTKTKLIRSVQSIERIECSIALVQCMCVRKSIMAKDWIAVNGCDADIGSDDNALFKTPCTHTLLHQIANNTLLCKNEWARYYVELKCVIWQIKYVIVCLRKVACTAFAGSNMISHFGSGRNGIFAPHRRRIRKSL